MFEEERTLERLRPKIELLGQLLGDLVEPLPHVAEVRRAASCAGSSSQRRQPALRPPTDGPPVTLEARAPGAIIRPLGDVVVLMPPLSIEADVLEELVEVTADSIAAATESWAGLRAA